MDSPIISKTNLLGLDRKAMQLFFESIGEKPYRADQVLKWIHQEGVQDFQTMSNLSKLLRKKLETQANCILPEVLHAKAASDDTFKWILKLHDGNCIETVYIPQRGRGTLCISSQVGCVLNCDFCSTGKQGFNRNLTTAEIISQLWIAARQFKVTNVVMMGMGEPLLNLENVIPALNLMLDDFAYGLSKYRVTVSTAGIVPGLAELRQASDVALAVSLHAPNDTLRNELVPINKKYPLNELIAACRDYFKNEPRRSITMEYVMLAGINDTSQHAKQLIQLLSNLKVKVNLIPFNPFPNTDYQRSSTTDILKFRDILMKAGLNTTIRRTRGDDIDAACGQLVGAVQDRTQRQQQHRHTGQKNAQQLTNQKIPALLSRNS